MKVKTLQADTTNELDYLMGLYLDKGWEMAGDMSTFRYVRQHAVHGYDVWETAFCQRMTKK